MTVNRLTHEPYSSDDQSHRITSKVNRNYEALECIDKVTPNQCDNATNEHRDDEGVFFCPVFVSFCSFDSSNLCQAGVMEEMVDDTLEMQEDDEIEEEADAEVDKVLFELTDGKLGEAGSVGTELPVIGPSLVDSVLAHICDRRHKMHLMLAKRQRSSSTDGSSITYSADKTRASIPL